MSTHQQLLYHIVFSTKQRKDYLKNDAFRANVFAYMAGTSQELGGFAIVVGGYHDHAHLLLRIPAKLDVSSFVGQLKANTSKHINDSGHSLMKFGWQDGFGAFSVSASMKDQVTKYIGNQVAHHRVKSFQEEYLEFLNKHEVEYDSKYLWD
jgi:REP element-mobilizing transposase RayT